VTGNRELVHGMGNLTILRPTGAVKAVALVLHGGTDRSNTPVKPHSASVLRMYPFARRLEKLGAASGLAVARLTFQVRGWNGTAQSPVHDARWALTELDQRFPEAPVGLVGHSMGGRTVLAAAGEKNVHSVVALAPWVLDYDPIETVAGRRFLVMHGDGDRLTSPVASADYVRRARALTQSASFVEVENERHPMILRASIWHRLTTAFTLKALAEVASIDVPDEQLFGRGRPRRERELRRAMASAFASEDTTI